MAEERKEGYHWLSPSTIVYCDQQMLKRFPHAVPIPSPDELAMLQRKAAAGNCTLCDQYANILDNAKLFKLS